MGALRKFRALLVLLAAAPLTAQTAKKESVPDIIKIDGRLVQPNGQPIPCPAPAVFSLHSNPQNGIALWSEVLTIECDPDGRFTALLGSQLPIPKMLFEKHSLWVHILVDSTSLWQQLTAVAYSRDAQNAHELAGRPAADYVTRDELVPPREDVDHARSKAEPDSVHSRISVVQHPAASFGTSSATESLAEPWMAPDWIGVLSISKATTGQQRAFQGELSSPDATVAVLKSRAGGTILQGIEGLPDSEETVFEVDGTGKVRATSFFDTSSQRAVKPIEDYLPGVRFAGQEYNGSSSLQAAIDDAGTSGAVVIPPNYSGPLNFTNPSSVSVLDLRAGGELTTSSGLLPASMTSTLGARGLEWNAFLRDITARTINGTQIASAFTSLQEAIDAAVLSGSGKVFLPAGSYSVNSTLQLASGICVEGVGGDKSVVVLTGVGNLSGAGRQHWCLKNLHIDSTGATAPYALTTDKLSSDYSIERVSVAGAANSNTTNGSILLSGSRFRFIHNTLDKVSAVFVSGASDFSIDDTFCYEYRTCIYAFDSTEQSGRWATISNTHCVSLGDSGPPLNGMDCVLVENSKFLNIHDNMIHEALEHCIYVSDSTKGSSHIKLADNFCTGWRSGAGIKIRGNAGNNGLTYDTDISLTGNVSAGSHLVSSQCFGLEGIRGLSSTGNIARDCDFGFYMNNLIGAKSGLDTADGNLSAGFTLRDALAGNQHVEFIGDNASNNNQAGNGFPGFQVALSGGFQNSDIRFTANSANDYQSVATQGYGFGLSLTGSSTLDGIDYSLNTGSGNKYRLYNDMIVSPVNGITDLLLLDKNQLVRTQAAQGLDNKDLIGAGGHNRVTLLDILLPLPPVSGSGGPKAVYTYTIPADTVAAGKCFRVTFQFAHTVGSADVTYNVYLGAVAGTSIGSLKSNLGGEVGDGQISSTVCNNPGVQNLQTWWTDRLTIGSSWVGSMDGEAAEDLSSNVTLYATFDAPDSEQVTPKRLMVESVQ